MDIPDHKSGGRRAGSVERDGLYTVFEGSCRRPTRSGLVRLWVHGGGESAYLGVMEPRNGGLWLAAGSAAGSWRPSRTRSNSSPTAEASKKRFT